MKRINDAKYQHVTDGAFMMRSRCNYNPHNVHAFIISCIRFLVNTPFSDNSFLSLLGSRLRNTLIRSFC